METRNAYKMQVEQERQKRVAEREKELKEIAKENSELKILVAVATKGGGKINEHFGHAKEFQIYELSTKGSKFIGHRRVDLYCQGGYGEEEALETVIRAIRDCVAVFVAKIGSCPKEALEKAGIETVDRFAYEYIEKAAVSYFKEYLRKVNAGLIHPTKKEDALIRQGALVPLN